MAYSPKTWTEGDPITPTDLNRIETGVSANDAARVPTGVVLPFASDTAPSGWLFCYGQAVSRSTYAALWNVIGDKYGAGDGSTTFNLPDLRGRMPLGKDNMGGSAANRVTATQAGNLGQASGAQTHTLSVAEMPAHSHGMPQRYAGDYAGDAPGLAQSSGSYTARVTADTRATSSAGSGSAHNNMPPYQTFNYIIKT